MADYDFRFAWEGADGAPWSHLLVAQVRAREQISSLFRYELVVVAKPPAPEVDPTDLVGRHGTLRISTTTNPPCRVVHGVISEAEELYPVPEGMLMRVVLSPPLVRAAHRKRSRIFLEKSLRQIIEAVLETDKLYKQAPGMVVSPDDGTNPDFSAALARYSLRVADTTRLDDPTVRPYVVQYNETDLDFLSRLLEEEGISYHFENGLGISLLVLSDADGGRARLDPFDPCGSGIMGRDVSTMKIGARLRPKKVQLDDFDWRKPKLMLATNTVALADDLIEHHYPGGYQDAPVRGEPLAKFRQERYGVEAEYAVGHGKLRMLGAGSIFQLEHNKPRYEGEYLVTAIDITIEQSGVATIPGQPQNVPYEATFECVRRGKDGVSQESRYRPPRITPKPRIVGSQTAFVTAAPGTKGVEIHVGGPQDGEIGCVRLRFHWDRDSERHKSEPTSCWVRVSQTFTGAGLGAVWHPRVDSEVVVEYIDGDPDRPIITGRVYNGANLPPAPSVGSPTISTFKSLSSPGGQGYNEFMFDDAAGAELVRIHAARDWNSEVVHDRNESVGNNSSSSVKNNRTETTGVNRSTTVGSNNTEIVGASESISIGQNQSTSVGVNQALSVGVNQSTVVGANQITTVGANQTVSVGANQTTSIGASHTVSVAAAQTISVGASQTETIGASHTMSVGGADTVSVGGAQTISVGGAQTMSVGGAQTLTAGGTQTLTAPNQVLDAGGSVTISGGAAITATAPFTAITGDGMLTLTGATTIMTGGSITVRGGTIAINGGAVSINGSPVTVNGGPSVDVSAGVIKLN
ncbi:MAG: type VI secretion system tip protein VgrG [Polyangiaceae bacterium]|nr:type VI secretion system tip protein VgrG [Polyangiaceae bacterium]